MNNKQNDVSEDNVEKLAEEMYGKVKVPNYDIGFVDGYLKAKENTYTEEDIIDAIGMARNEPDMNWKDIIQSLKQQEK